MVDYAEPKPGPIVRSGANTLDTEAFALTGGDYLVTSVLKSGGEPCSLSGYLIPVEEYNLFASVGDVSADSPKRKQTESETRFYEIDPGQYYWSVRASNSGIQGTSCKWTLTLENQS